ncbi:MAG: PilN domain-containing protein, partial [Anaerolineaceae bacterium]|nr:PilN domain-containing protein [Anaerolineaceae bacterium]
GLVSVFPVWQYKNLASQLLPKVNAAQQEAEKVLALRKELENAIESSGFLLQKRQNTPFVIDLLDELTHLFPDGTWVEQLEIKSNEIRVRGQSGEASALIERLEASKWFHEVTFLSPVTNDKRTGKDRFYLVAKTGWEP